MTRVRQLRIGKEDEKQHERQEHNETYRALARAQLREYRPGDYEAEVATPAIENNGVLAGEVNRYFLDRVLAILEAHDPRSVRILDYGCGMGKLSVWLAQRGFKNVEGFDISEEGVAFGTKLAELNGVSNAVVLQPMDAEHLTYDDESFDVVVGKAVLHHTIKYGDTATELCRVMRPGAQAIFKENLGNNPALKLGRFVTMDLIGRHGDVNITSKMVRQYASCFGFVHIEAWNCLYMAKRLLWAPGQQPRWRRALMRLLAAVDNRTVHRSERWRERLCGEAVFVLTK